MYKEIIILAKSSKHSEYCIAGVDIITGEWIRPVSTNIVNEGSVPESDITYDDGNQLQRLDKVKIKLLSPNPTISQPENYIYDPNVCWKKTGESTLEELVKHRGYDKVKQIFYNHEKAVSKKEIGGQPSLLFVDVRNSYIFVKTFYNGDRRIQFNFKHNSIDYKYFKVSDEAIKNDLLNVNDGEYKHRDNLPVVFSLTDEYDLTGKYYKMVAQMFY